MKKVLSFALLALFCLFANVARAQGPGGQGQGGQGAVVDTALSLDSLSFTAWGDNSTYTYDGESDTGTLTLTSSWTGGEWDLNDASESAYFGVYVRIKTTATCKIRLTVVYNSSGTEHYENYAIVGSGNDSEQWLFLPLDKDYDTDVEKIRIMCGDIGEESSVTITLLSAELISPDDGGVNDNIRRIKTSTNEGYGTYCCDKDFEMPEYLEGYIITNVAKEKSSTSREDVEEDTTGDDGNTENSTDAKARVKKLAEGDEVDEVDEGGDNDDGDATDSDYDFSEGYYITIKKAFVNDSTDTSGNYSKIVPAGVAILVKGCGDAPDAPITYTAYVDDENVAEGQEKYVASDEDMAKAEGNLLLGNSSGQNSMSSTEMENATLQAYNTEGGTTYTADQFYYYYLDYGKVTTANGSTTYDYLGFYWMNNAGSAFEMTSNRAWLPLLKSNFENGGSEPISLKIIEYVEDDSEEQTTGITTVPTAAVETVSDGAIYTIQGVRVNNMNKPGVYIVDGKKVIKK